MQRNGQVVRENVTIKGRKEGRKNPTTRHKSKDAQKARKIHAPVE